jgi:hypothetical protein
MTAYGSPAPGTFDWGWRGLSPAVSPDLNVERNVRIQFELNGGAGLFLRARYITSVEGAS